MNFLEASVKMVHGEKMRLSTWPEDMYMFYDGVYNTYNEEYGISEFNDIRRMESSCLISHNWVVYEEQFDFKQAMKYLINGKKISRKTWKQGHYKKVISYQFNVQPVYTEEDIDAEDWVIVE